MGTTKLNIGKIPISKGEYQEGTAYQRLNQVTMLGSTYQSKIDDNTSAPAQMGADGAVENINTDKWLCIAVGNVSAAKKVVYNNETSGLEAGNVQEAIDESNTKVTALSATINKESELGVIQHFVKDDFTTKVEVKETNFFQHNDVVKLICTNKSSLDSWFSVGTFGTDDSESEIQSKEIKAGESLVIDRTEQYSGNGYWCKSIGNAKGKFEVYRIDPKVTENTKELAKKIDKNSVVQESGDSEELVMSQKAVSAKLSNLSSTINKESELGVIQHFVKDDFTTKVEVKETNFFQHNDVVKLICTNKSSLDSWFSVGTFGTDDSESEIQSKEIKAGESLVIDRTEQYSGNGYWCKSIGNAKGKFEVYRIDPKVTENTKELAKKIDKNSVVQESGDSEELVMSQKAVSAKLNKINNNGLKIILSKQADSGRLEFDYPYSKGTELSLVVTNLGSSEGYFTIGAIDTNGVDSEIITQKLEAGQSYTVNRKEIYSGKGYYCNSVNNKAFTYELIELNEVFRTLQAKVESSEIRPKVYVGPTRKYTKFTDGLSKAVELGNADLYVDAGTYDIVAELTIAKIDSDSIAGYYGPKIGRGVRIYFSQGAKIIANYTGTLNVSLERFSPLNAIETTDIGGSDFEIHGGEFECTNVRYVVHDECNGKGSYKHLYDNCRMILDNRNKTYFKTCQCIGGGLGEFADIQIIGGYYESKSIDINKSDLDQVISYHNPQSDFGSNFCNSVMIKDAYFKDGTIIVSQLGDSLKYSTFVANNCSTTKAPYINGKNDAGTGRFRMQSWNNDIRNS